MEIGPNVGGHAYSEVVGWCLKKHRGGVGGRVAGSTRHVTDPRVGAAPACKQGHDLRFVGVVDTVFLYAQ